MADTKKINHKLAITDTAIESAGLGVAEVVSAGVSLGTVAVLDRFAPHMVHAVSDTLAKVVFEPYIDHIESFMSKVCKLEDCKPDKNKSREERAKQLAYATMLYVPAIATSIGVKIVTRRGMNHLLGVREDTILNRKWWEIWKMTHNEAAIFALDEGTHAGSLILLNTGAAKYTDELINSSTGLLEKIGIPKDRARRLANMAMIWELPNAIGFAFGVGGVAGKNYHVWNRMFGKKDIGGHR